MRTYTHRPTQERFWEKVEKTDTCWFWRGETNRYGYGVLGFYDENRRVGIAAAHRLAYEWLVGPISEGLTIDHLCRVRNCVNPSHLELVTRAENVLRGESAPAENARKTHCDAGHPFSESNTYITPAGRRQCRTCQRERKRRWLRQRQAESVSLSEASN